MTGDEVVSKAVKSEGYKDILVFRDQKDVLVTISGDGLQIGHK